MPHRPVFWLLLLVAFVVAPGFGATRPPALHPDIPLRFQRGDDPAWAARDFDDSAWRQVGWGELPSRDGIYWVRWRARQFDPNTFGERDGMLFKVVASYELYWDGHLIGRNGRVSARESDEMPGNVDALFQIPRELLEVGEHVVALRMSSFHTGFRSPTYGLVWEWGNFRTMLIHRSRTALLSVMAVGATLIGGIVFGLMWLLAGRRVPLLLLSGLCFSAAAMQALQAWRWLFEYPYDWHYPRLVTISGLVTAMAVLLPAFVMHHFGLRGRRIVYPLLALLIAAAWFSSRWYNIVALNVCAAGFITAFVLALRATWLRRRGALLASSGLAISVVALVLAPRDFLDHAFFLSGGPAILGLLIVVVLQLRDERRDAQRAVLTAARLETEMLKKNIQPHFLLNTLATIQETIEQEPKTAVALIDALAGEFRILSGVSGETLIPLGQELELCQAHLRVMRLRKAAACELVTHGIDERAPVPPALFHTLIENGLTHLLPVHGRLDFELRAEESGGVTRYRLLARGSRQNGKERRVREGTGLRYIRARLEESFPGQWTLHARPVAEGWETIIEVRSAHAPLPGRATEAAAAWASKRPA